MDSAALDGRVHKQTRRSKRALAPDGTAGSGLLIRRFWVRVPGVQHEGPGQSPDQGLRRSPLGRARMCPREHTLPEVEQLCLLQSRSCPISLPCSLSEAATDRRGGVLVTSGVLAYIPTTTSSPSTPHRTANASSRRNSRGTQGRRRPETMEMLLRRCARMESTWWVAAVKAGRPLSRGPIRPRSPLLCAPRACRPWCFCLLCALWSRRPRRLGTRRFGCRHGLTRRGLISALVRGPFSFWRLGDGRHQWLLCRLFSHTDGFLGLLGLRRLDPRSGCLAGRLARRRDPATWSMARTPPARGARHEVVEHLLIQGCIWYSGCRHCPSR
jgi:hypothetical protein